MSSLVRISGSSLALILALPDRGMPEIVFFGTNGLVHEIALDAIPAMLKRASRVNGMDQQAASAVLLPTGGMGFFGWPAISGHRSGQDFIVEPTQWAVAQTHESAATLTGTDAAARLTITLAAMINGSGSLVLNSAIRNDATGPYTLDRCMAGSLLLPEDQATITTFEGMWGAEFQMRKEVLGSGLWLKESRRGRTSHDRFPGVLFERQASEDFGGTVTAAHLAWSGNHVMALDRLDDGRRLLHMGELFEPGEIQLAKGESYQSPDMVLVRDWQGMDGVTNTFHGHVREEVVSWPGGAMKPRPVILNTWEGNYFKHDVEKLKAQATAAAKLGIERFVLDDGWFGKRDDDTTSLGDWFVDTRKYPEGLTPLIHHVKSLGMEFGLWFEPEMINLESALYRAHPDWVLQVKGRPLLPSRQQFVLDLARQEVSDYLFACLDSLLTIYAIDYIKWDMNRDITHAGDAAGRAATSRQTRAFYALMKRIREAHPNVEIESCASGGGRLDYGALKNAHRVWTSDCTDALQRLEIQRGAGIFLPPEVMGAHVSASPNHQTHRRHSMQFRALVALPYHFGVELNPLEIPADEFAELAGYIALHKRLRSLFHSGSAFRFNPQDGRHIYGWRSNENDHAVLFIAQAQQQVMEMSPPVRVPELDPDHSYRLSIPAPQKAQFVRSLPEQHAFLNGSTVIPGGLLEMVGIHVPTLFPESAIMIEITKDNAGGRHG
jgi:alpha-galactosidase